MAILCKTYKLDAYEEESEEDIYVPIEQEYGDQFNIPFLNDFANLIDEFDRNNKTTCLYNILTIDNKTVIIKTHPSAKRNNYFGSDEEENRLYDIFKNNYTKDMTITTEMYIE